jgi:hypothetical protein
MNLALPGIEKGAVHSVALRYHPIIGCYISRITESVLENPTSKRL